MNLSAPITSLPGIGPALTKKLAKLGITTVISLLYHLPSRYEDRTASSLISRVQPGETLFLTGTLSDLKNQYTKNRKIIQTARLTDASGSLPLVWFNQPFLTKTLKNGQEVTLWGKADIFNRHLTLVSPDYEIINSDTLVHIGRIVPIYPETAGLTSKWLRAKIHHLLAQLPLADPWPAPNLPSWTPALNYVHFPPTLDPVGLAHHRRRLAFDELLILQLSSLLHRQAWDNTRLSHPFTLNKTQVQQFITSLPFSLTPSQSTAIKDILSDLADVKPMNRLLEGDVGSGKTIVAAIAAYVAHLNGFQTLILAPTQLLAQQHFATLSALFQPFNLTVTLLTSSHKTISPANHLVVGTHALLSGKYHFEKVGLIVIDEQHRFGVAQRALAASLGESPHILTMTATPIPRSIALTLHGDLDLSLLTHLPPGRQPVKTWVIPESKRPAAAAWLNTQLTQHHQQIFVICPFIEPSETLSTVKAAAAEFEKIQKLFPTAQVGLLHGKLKAQQKHQVLEKFRVGESQILVCTPIVEVGIDIPTAGIIVIEDADRFGLAQLHQLRGRVGRGSHQSYCLLFGPPTHRLKAMETHSSGLQLAEIDLQLRGPGQIYGTLQHGLSELKIASYTDLQLLENTKSHAAHLLPQLDCYPLLRKLVQTDKINLVQPN